MKLRSILIRVSAEALIRLNHPERGILAPGAFIGALGDSAVAIEAGRWILTTAYSVGRDLGVLVLCHHRACNRDQSRRDEELLFYAANFPLRGTTIQPSEKDRRVGFAKEILGQHHYPFLARVLLHVPLNLHVIRVTHSQGQGARRFVAFRLWDTA